eukprot:TRINITY_DN1324_c0_g4_i3.p1 TRINITY_DN1324_c0_g4~~TRINITY_DN1324_c0_g4_i3.p1  ORF type:complete len:72 (-),score=4.53 TRINITY_DN1324_c0_g4_i3:77-292(-)
MCLKLIFSVIYVRKFLGYYNASPGLAWLNTAIFFITNASGRHKRDTKCKKILVVQWLEMQSVLGCKNHKNT